jgi:hypothetical protein
MKRSILTAVAVVGMTTAAQAQAPITRANNESVAERQRPDYDALGIRLGAFEMLPTVKLAAETNDNIFAREIGAQDDVIFTITPALSIASDWSKNALRIDAHATNATYQDFDSEDFDEVGVSGQFRADISPDANVAVGGEYWDGVEPRISPDAATSVVNPIEYSRQNAFIGGAYTFSRLRVSARAEVNDLNYENGRTALGAVVDQQFRDHQENVQTLRFEYAVTPSTALVLQGQTDQYNYDHPATGPGDSDGYNVRVGANADITNLLRGEVTVGYLRREFDKSNLTIEGFAADANLEYFITRLTTITFTGSRDVQDAGFGSILPIGRVATRYGVRADHELLRNVVVTGGISGGTDDYKGIDRNDDLFEGQVGARYLLNRHAELGANYYYTDVQSSGLNRDRDFNVNRFLVSVTLKL